MKKSRVWYFIISLILILLVGYIILPYITPGISIVNRTEKVVYIRRSQFAMTGVEPTIREMDDWKKLWTMQAGEERYFPVSFSTLTSSRLIRFSSGWRIGSQSEYSASGGHSFDTNRDEGICRAKIEIYNDSYKFFTERAFGCYKKLFSLGGRMTVYTEEKTITSDYAPATGELEKQTVRTKG